MRNVPTSENGNGLRYLNPNGRNGNGQHNSHGHGSSAGDTPGVEIGRLGFAESFAPALAVTTREEVYDPQFEALIESMLERLGEDPQRDGLLRTPLRVAKAMDFLTSGYHTQLDAIINDAVFEDDGQEMVIVRDIEFYSLCEHHMLPFYGKMHIAYIPDGKIIGLSKLARITDLFARRLQVQERLTNQIADTLAEILQPKGVAVAAEAAHFCMMMRGVQKQGSTTLTSAMRGIFKEDDTLRREFMQSVRG